MENGRTPRGLIPDPHNHRSKTVTVFSCASGESLECRYKENIQIHLIRRRVGGWGGKRERILNESNIMYEGIEAVRPLRKESRMSVWLKCRQVGDKAKEFSMGQSTLASQAI